MRILTVFCCLLFALNAHAAYDDSVFIDRCYFSDDGQRALVSELKFMRLRDYANRIPVFGLYQPGKNAPNHYIAISNDSVYFYRDTVLSYTIDSVFDRQFFLNKYHFTRLGKNVTADVKIDISTKFLRAENTIKLWKLADKFPIMVADSDTRFYDYFLQFTYNGKVIFADTLLNTYAEKPYLLSSIGEIVKKEVFDEAAGHLYRGTEGYGTRIYADDKHGCFFIRGRYDIGTHVAVYSKMEDTDVGLTFDHAQEALEIRVLQKTNP